MPGEKDFAVGAVGGGQQGVPSGAVYAGGLPQGSAISKKPCYLVTLDGVSKSGKSVVARFIAVDKPDFNNAAFAQVKGFYTDSTEEEVVVNFLDIIRDTPKDQIMEVMFPTHKIHSIRSLVFSAEKPKSLVK
jgi:hypothetical protein